MCASTPPRESVISKNHAWPLRPSLVYWVTSPLSVLLGRAGNGEPGVKSEEIKLPTALVYTLIPQEHFADSPTTPIPLPPETILQSIG